MLHFIFWNVQIVVVFHIILIRFNLKRCRLMLRLHLIYLISMSVWWSGFEKEAMKWEWASMLITNTKPFPIGILNLIKLCFDEIHSKKIELKGIHRFLPHMRSGILVKLKTWMIQRLVVSLPESSTRLQILKRNNLDRKIRLPQSIDFCLTVAEESYELECRMKLHRWIRRLDIEFY